MDEGSGRRRIDRRSVFYLCSPALMEMKTGSSDLREIRKGGGQEVVFYRQDTLTPKTRVERDTFKTFNEYTDDKGLKEIPDDKRSFKH